MTQLQVYIEPAGDRDFDVHIDKNIFLSTLTMKLPHFKPSIPNASILLLTPLQLMFLLFGPLLISLLLCLFLLHVLFSILVFLSWSILSVFLLSLPFLS